MQWNKLGKVFAPQDDSTLPWARTHAYLPTPLLMENRGVIRVYCSFLDSEKIGRIGYVDVDADDPLKVVSYSEHPVLDVGQPGTFDEHGVNPVSVVRDGDEVRLYYQGWQRLNSVPYAVFTGLAISRDGGESFTRYSQTPVLPKTTEEPFLRSAGFVVRREEDWAVWYNCTVKWFENNDRKAPWYQIRYLTSADGLNWSREGHVCMSPADDEDLYGVSRPVITRLKDRYAMWFSYRRKSNTYRLGYAESQDGLTWTSMDDNGLPEPSASGWDSEMVCFGAPVSVGRDQYLFYNGNQYGATGFGVAAGSK